MKLLTALATLAISTTSFAGYVIDCEMKNNTLRNGTTNFRINLDQCGRVNLPGTNQVDVNMIQCYRSDPNASPQGARYYAAFLQNGETFYVNYNDEAPEAYRAVLFGEDQNRPALNFARSKTFGELFMKPRSPKSTGAYCELSANEEV